ncbi:MAG: hypothetical protein IJ466_07225 [Clostridia bacterium]|nr:hypothetical protein [Clostridia bacterium]
MSEQKHESCTGCRYDLGGGRDNCTLCVAAECRDGGGFEAWKAIPESIANAASSLMQSCLSMRESRWVRQRDELLTEIEKIVGEKCRERFFEIARADKHEYGIETELDYLYQAKKALLAGGEPKDVLLNMDFIIRLNEMGLLR